MSEKKLKKEKKEKSSKKEDDGQTKMMNDFNCGVLYQRFSSFGMPAEQFNQLMNDFKTLFHIKQETTSVDTASFNAGRIFESYASSSGEKAMLSADDFEKLLVSLRLGNDSNLRFSAGMTFQKYCSDDKNGVTADKFQSLIKDSDLGKLLYDAFLKNKSTDSSSTKIPSDVHSSVQNETSHEKPVHSRYDRKMKQVEEIENQINKYLEEIEAEQTLQYQLPEAYSEAKEKLLKQHIDTLQKKKNDILRSVKKLNAANYNPIHPSTIQYQQRRQHSFPSFPMHPAYFLPNQQQHPQQATNYSQYRYSSFPAASVNELIPSREYYY